MAKENNAKRSVPAEIITPEIRSHVEAIAAEMIGKSALRKDDFQDLCQNMYLEILKNIPLYDSARSGFYTFVCWIVKCWRADFYNRRIAKGQDQASIPYDSTDAVTGQSRHEIETATNSVDDEMRKQDIRFIVNTLPPVQKELCKRLLAGQALTTAATEMGISKYELYNHTLPLIRSKFKTEGF